MVDFAGLPVEIPRLLSTNRRTGLLSSHATVNNSPEVGRAAVHQPGTFAVQQGKRTLPGRPTRNGLDRQPQASLGHVTLPLNGHVQSGFEDGQQPGSADEPPTRSQLGVAVGVSDDASPRPWRGHGRVLRRRPMPGFQFVSCQPHTASRRGRRMWVSHTGESCRMASPPRSA